MTGLKRVSIEPGGKKAYRGALRQSARLDEVEIGDESGAPR
jgi:hypothetical protein